LQALQQKLYCQTKFGDFNDEFKIPPIKYLKFKGRKLPCIGELSKIQKTYSISKEARHAVTLSGDVMTTSSVVAVTEFGALNAPGAGWAPICTNITLRKEQSF